MRVDQIPKFATDWPAGARFSAILTERHLQLVSVNCVRDWSFRAFHRFTAIITTTSFIVFKIFKIFRCDDCGCELLLFHFIGDCEGRSCVSHLFPQRWDIRRTLYFAKKRVQYGSGGIEATEAVNAVLVGGKLHHDRTWNGTRGISSDGIQRHKVRAVE